MKKLFFLLFLPLMSFAGEKGNGGYAIVCRDNNNQITSAELLDIYEGRVLYKRSYAVDMNSTDELIELAKTRIGDFGSFLNKLNKELSFINQNLIFIPNGNELEPTDDAFPPIKKKGCQFEQLANYTNLGEVLISQEIYDHLDNINKAALFIHEAVYAIRRKAVGDETSQVSRRIVAHLMATNPDSSVIERWISDTVYRPNNKRPCGLEGSIEVRIESCSYLQSSMYPFVLVSRNKDQEEIWLDQSQKLLWSDRLDGYYNFDEASEGCMNAFPISGHKWRLPSISEFEANAGLMIYQLPNFTRFSESYWFWSATVKGRFIQTFNGADGITGSNIFRRTKGSVRCVAPLN